MLDHQLKKLKRSQKKGRALRVAGNATVADQQLALINMICQ
jgi:hypothetical protein